MPPLPRARLVGEEMNGLSAHHALIPSESILQQNEIMSISDRKPPPERGWGNA
jgi:hypothetical protein